MNTKTMIVGALGAGAVAAGLTLAGAPAASARTCSQVVEAINSGGEGPTTGESWACASVIHKNAWTTFGPNLVAEWKNYPQKLKEQWAGFPGFPDPEPSAEEAGAGDTPSAAGEGG